MYRETLIAHPERRAFDSPLPLRNPTPEDQEGLAALFLAAYTDSPESAGETREGCRAEAAAYLSGTYGEPRLSCSFVAFDNSGGLVGACLTLIPRDKDRAVIAYLCTHPRWRRRGIARALLAHTLSTLHLEGFDLCEVRVGTKNEPARHLLRQMGFSLPGQGDNEPL